MGDEIPTLDLRVSEFSPDRASATASWAHHELQRQEYGRAARHEADAKLWADRIAAAKEHQTALRLEAVKRGEVYVPPKPPVPAYSASVYPYATGGTACYR